MKTTFKCIDCGKQGERRHASKVRCVKCRVEYHKKLAKGLKDIQRLKLKRIRDKIADNKKLNESLS